MISVRRHLTKNRPGLPQKSSETPSTGLLDTAEWTQGPHLRTRERGPKDPAAQTLNGVVAPFRAPSRLLRQLLVHEQDRRGHGSSHSRQAAIPSRSRDFDPETRRLQLRHAFGLWVSLRHPIFTTGSMPFWLADAAKETTALSVLFSFHYFLRLFHATHFIASPRSPGIGRLPETVKHLAVSPCPLGMGLRSGLTVYFEGRDRGLRVPLPPAQYEFDGFPEAVSSGVHPRTGWTFCPT